MADEDSEVERFRTNNGRVVGVIGLAGVLLLLALEVAAGPTDVSPGLVAGCLLVALVIWVVLLRPAARVEGGDLVLRGPVDTLWIPLAAIEQVAVGSILAVRADGRRFSSTAVNRSHRETARDVKAGSDIARRSYGAYVEDRIQRLAEDAQVAGRPAGGVRRAWAWPEIAGLVVLTLAFVVTLLV